MMKKYLMTLAAFLCCAMMTTVFTSCSDDETTGDFVYTITTSDDTSTTAEGSYWMSGAETTVLAEVAKVGTKLNENSRAYKLSGSESDCNNKIKAAVDAGMNTVEAQSGYGSTFDLSGVTVVIKNVNDSKQIYSRKFKKVYNYNITVANKDYDVTVTFNGLTSVITEVKNTPTWLTVTPQTALNSDGTPAVIINVKATDDGAERKCTLHLTTASNEQVVLTVTQSKSDGDNENHLFPYPVLPNKFQ